MMRRSSALESQSSFDKIQQLVKREGKSARNLVAWSVPAVHTEQANAGRATRRVRGTAGARRRPIRTGSSERLSRSEKMCRVAAGQYSSSALGRKEGARPATKADVHARYWSYLFGNLFRAVDEIYRTCEVDGSVIECQVYTRHVASVATPMGITTVCLCDTGGDDDSGCLPQRFFCSDPQNRDGERAGDMPTAEVRVPSCIAYYDRLCVCLMQTFRCGMGSAQDILTIQANSL